MNPKKSCATVGIVLTCIMLGMRAVGVPFEPIFIADYAVTMGFLTWLT